MWHCLVCMVSKWLSTILAICVRLNMYHLADEYLFVRFLRNPTELKSIKNISLLRQQMEAQAAAQKLAAQHAANAALRSLTPAAAAAQAAGPGEAAAADLEDGVAAVQPESPPGGVLSSSSDEPTDLTMDAEEKAIRNRDRMEREHRYGTFRHWTRGLALGSHLLQVNAT